MQQAIPYKSWLPLYTKTTSPLTLFGTATTAAKQVLKGSTNMGNMVRENAIIVFAKKGCCMSHVVKRLLLGLGVNPPIFEIDEQEEISVLQELELIVDNNKDDNNGNDDKVQLPAVFIGGRLFGGLDRLMATHISGELVPILKDAGALWL
ncbi:glutaredoxin-C9 [Ricinus communis]|uniref:Glutaredoxin, grx, putative n=1 Tax=Ricinus communis TaxID=3988 RepID=B9RVS3_RICCO|nr:glutaredoxin-C9 [Ricinus communis]EEF44360.1 glutaredoxin, grx, putative [Ricinus communis]|eukprot:XP_002517842.1 glutaredoxin-C9 [Ricinus communis]